MTIITLTTDFGTRDGFVGAMKGVIARMCDATIVDIAHDIPRHDIAHAAWVVANSCVEFPKGTIHVVVVDPGVGTLRRGVIALGFGSYYVGPDNGVFAYLQPEEAWWITSPRYAARRISHTFEGRDVFAVAAAMLVTEGRPNLAGPSTTLRGTLPWGPQSIVHVDVFGNLVTNLTAHDAGQAVLVGDRTLPVRDTYADVEVGELVAYVGSAGTIEIAVREGRAADRLKLERGAPVTPVATATTGPYR